MNLKQHIGKISMNSYVHGCMEIIIIAAKVKKYTHAYLLSKNRQIKLYEKYLQVILQELTTNFMRQFHSLGLDPVSVCYNIETLSKLRL